jgi:purine-binding chemotaxis protein CheW
MSSQPLARQNRETGSGTCSLVTFLLAEQTYALPIAPIVQIVEMVAMTALPQAGDAIEGVINYHGVAVPVIDLRRHLGLPAIHLHPDTHMVILTVAERMVGLAVDRVLQVVDLPGRHISHTQDVMPDGLGRIPLLQGVARTAEGTVLVLDPDQLFTSDAALTLSRAASAIPAGRAMDRRTETESQV